MSTLNTINTQLQTLYDEAVAATSDSASTLTEQVELLIAHYYPTAQTYYVSSTEPDSSLGVDGDICLVTG